ncbi:MAG: Flp family type IVb pilin [Carboxydocellales bacterium]|jgi:pilus assembly protein Flp/PilA
MTNMLKRLWRDEEGQGMTEYGLIIGLIAILLISVLIGFKDKLIAIFQRITNDTTLPAS